MASAASAWRPPRFPVHLQRRDEVRDLAPGHRVAENLADLLSRLEALGARRVNIGHGEVSWVVMADSDELDVLRPHVTLSACTRSAA